MANDPAMMSSMADNLTSIVVLRSHYQTERGIKPFVDEHGMIRYQIFDSTTPYYVRLKVKFPDSVAGEILLPHDAVLLILLDVPVKTLGFTGSS
jgi:hypothetical protein